MASLAAVLMLTACTAKVSMDVDPDQKNFDENYQGSPEVTEEVVPVEEVVVEEETATGSDVEEVVVEDVVVDETTATGGEITEIEGEEVTEDVVVPEEVTATGTETTTEETTES